MVKIWQLIDLPFHIHLRHFTIYIQSTKGEDLSTLLKVRDKICVPLSHRVPVQFLNHKAISPAFLSQGII